MGGGPNPCAALSRLYSPPRETLWEEGGKGKQDPSGAHGNRPVGGFGPKAHGPPPAGGIHSREGYAGGVDVYPGQFPM